jgi:hypothetical protein
VLRVRVLRRGKDKSQGYTQGAAPIIRHPRMQSPPMMTAALRGHHHCAGTNKTPAAPQPLSLTSQVCTQMTHQPAAQGCPWKHLWRQPRSRRCRGLHCHH